MPDQNMHEREVAHNGEPYHDRDLLDIAFRAYDRNEAKEACYEIRDLIKRK